jgi:hypothetical protein
MGCGWEDGVLWDGGGGWGWRGGGLRRGWAGWWGTWATVLGFALRRPLPHALRSDGAIPSILGVCCAVACGAWFPLLRLSGQIEVEPRHCGAVAGMYAQTGMAVGAHRQFTSGVSARWILSSSPQCGCAVESSNVWNREVRMSYSYEWMCRSKWM